MMKGILIALVLGAAILASVSLALGLRWEVEGREFVREQERSGGVEKERLTRQGDVFISEQFRLAAEEAARLVNHGKVQASRSLAVSEVLASEKLNAQGVTAAQKWAIPLFGAHAKAIELRHRRERITSPIELEEVDALIQVVEMARGDAPEITRINRKCIEEVRERSLQSPNSRPFDPTKDWKRN